MKLGFEFEEIPDEIEAIRSRTREEQMFFGKIHTKENQAKMLGTAAAHQARRTLQQGEPLNTRNKRSISACRRRDVENKSGDGTVSNG